MKNNPIEPSFQILICLIKIWTMKDSSNPLKVPEDAMCITECESIEIEESYKKLIGTASVKFPRGTVVRRTVTPEVNDKINQSNELTASIDDAGVIEEVRKQSSDVAKTSHFQTGQRIRIYLGYTDDPLVAMMAKTNNFNKKTSIYASGENRQKYEQAKYLSDKALHLMFDGYITKISIDTPIELHCENLASGLKRITCPEVTLKKKGTVNDFLSESGAHNMLKGTGLKLLPQSESQVFDLGDVKLNPDLTVADVLTEWSKYGVHAFVTEYNGQPSIAVGRSYFSNAQDDSIIKINGESAEPVEIRFNYHVAENGLSLTSADKKYLAVEAEGLDAENKFYHITVLRNPKYVSGDSSTGDPYRVLNETKISKKAMKLGIRPLSKSADNVSMDLYTKIPYHSKKIPVTKDDLMEEAIKYLESYNMNGIEGTLTLFGDLHLHTATCVHLVDNRYPGKNGVYLVDEVHTTFGNGGYRQSIKLPYCIKRDKKEENNEQ